MGRECDVNGVGSGPGGAIAACRTRLFRAAAACAIVALVVLPRWESAPRAASPIEEQFKYGSIGAEDQEGIPYWIWQVLPRMFADKLPPGGYGALGMIWEPGHDTPDRVLEEDDLGRVPRRDQLRVLPHRVGAHESGRRADDRARRRLAAVRSAGLLEVPRCHGERSPVQRQRR